MRRTPWTASRTIGHAYGVANTLDRVGHLHTTLGQHDQARTAWHEALELYREQDRDEDSERVQQLAGLALAMEPIRPSDEAETAENA